MNLLRRFPSLGAWAIALVCGAPWVLQAQTLSLAPEPNAQLPAPVLPRIFTLDPHTSSVRIYAFRGGAAARMGHNHVVSAPQFTGHFAWFSEQTVQSSFEISFRLDKLEFDVAEHRASLGGAFGSTITSEAKAATRLNMLGERGFESDQFPIVTIRSLQIVGEAPKFAARVAVNLHGQTKENWIALTVDGLPDTLRAQGAWVLRQTDFGVRPFSVLGGLLSVQDEIIIEFSLRGEVVPLPPSSIP